MKKTHVITAVVLSLVGAHALAAPPETVAEERKGAIIGTAIGAVAGGPIGAGVGAIIGGGFIGKMIGLHGVNEELDRQLAMVESRLEETEADMAAQTARLEKALRQSERARKALASAPELPIQFRTDSSTVEQHYQDQLTDVARLLAGRPDVNVQLSGFADRRGSAAYNQALSEARVEEVKQHLMRQGVSERQIAARAFGESRPVNDEASAEDYFFDRRVVMKFSTAGEESPVASR